MKKIFFAALTVFIFSCQDEKKESEIVPVTELHETPKALPEFAYPVDRSHWKIGDPANTKLVLDMYHAWDANDANAVAGFFADSAMWICRMPKEWFSIKVMFMKNLEKQGCNTQTLRTGSFQLFRFTTMTSMMTGFRS
jgi:hypothetical protein